MGDHREYRTENLFAGHLRVVVKACDDRRLDEEPGVPVGGTSSAAGEPSTLRDRRVQICLNPVALESRDHRSANGSRIGRVSRPAIGNYADYLTREIIPFVDREFRTLASREHRGCFGKSSGGYGAIIHGMKYAQHWGAIANHSGDAYFDFVYRHDWPNTLERAREVPRAEAQPGRTTLCAESAPQRPRRRYDDGRVERFLDALWKKEKLSSAEGHAIMNVCMAATYDPDPGAARLSPAVPPRDRRDDRRRAGSTGSATTRSTWSRVREGAEIPARHLHRLRLARPVPHPLRHAHPVAAPRRSRHRHTYEEFDDNHSDVDYRMDVSLPFLFRALKP